MQTSLTFKPETFTFKSGVNLSIDNEKIIAIAKDYNCQIDSKNWTSFSYQDYVESGLSPFGLVARIFFVGLIILFFVKNELSALVFQGPPQDIFLFWIGFPLMLLSVIGFFVMIIDAMLDLNLFRKLIGKYLAVHGYSVTIGGKNGGNINFVVHKDELKTIKIVEEKLNTLKRLFVSHQEQNISISVNSNNNLDDLRKLSELLKDGIITNQEFEVKKLQILK